MTKIFIRLLSCLPALVALACAANAGPDTDESDVDGVGSAGETLKPNCALVLCALPACGPGQVLETRPGQCCPVCVDPKPPIHAGDCACSGGSMNADVCGQFGAPWSWQKGACVWSWKSQGGLTEEQCAGIEAKHQGDGSGSDLYNLGLSCTYGVSDCRSKGCPAGQHCDVCKTVNGAAYVCLPDGSVC